jgi:translation initiation factor IF-2
MALEGIPIRVREMVLFSKHNLPVGSNLGYHIIDADGSARRPMKRRHGGTESQGRCKVGEEMVGKVQKFFAKPSVAAIEITAGVLRVGDTLHFRGHTTDFEQTITSMQVNNEPVEEAQSGDLIGVQVNARVREHDVVYRVGS